MNATPKAPKPTQAEPTVTPSESNLPVISQEAPRERGHLNIYGGRGGTGKSTHVKWIVEDGLRNGQLVFAADGDRFNQTTRANFPNALYPSGADAEQVGSWLISIADWAALERVMVSVDMGGGDREFGRMGAHLKAKENPDHFEDLAGLNLGDLSDLTTGGLDITLIYAMSGGYDDTNGLAMLMKRGLVGERTILLFNEAVVRDREARDVAQIFARIRDEDPHVKKAIELGAEVVIMPALDAEIMEWIERHRMSFSDAVAGKAPEGFKPLERVQRLAILKWLREMHKQHAVVLEKGLLG